ncbi:MAG TPA: type II toxin-antitoxin system VapC family toxin [Candidatus Nanoarchaeia archaeon]|nr:type II toxin-antitoxin system VapC family toxin [Candidatus Nanoarchaeia archaeon]
MPTCLDTDTIVEFFRGNKDVTERLDVLLKNGDVPVVTRITLCELFRGAYLSQHPEREAERIHHFMGSCRILGFPMMPVLDLGKYPRS